MDLTDAARPLLLKGDSDLGILLIHGFTSTPASVADWAHGLNQILHTSVSVPLLPGHGTRWEDLNQVTWEQWASTVLAAYDELASGHKRVAVGGLSLGGALACLVAGRRPACALVLVNHLMWLQNPALALALIKRITPSMRAVGGDIKKQGVAETAYGRIPTGGVDQFRRLLKVVRPMLPSIMVPTLLFKSVEDHVIPRISTTRTIKELGSTRKDLIWLENSYHVATLDNDLPLIVEKSATFLKEWSV